MQQTDFLADRLMRSLEMLRRTVDDFSDVDLLVRPAPGANQAMHVGRLQVIRRRPGEPAIV